MYTDVAPWDTGQPQPAFLRLTQSGRLAERVLDVGCGTGDNALLAAAARADVLGIDISGWPVRRARITGAVCCGRRT